MAKRTSIKGTRKLPSLPTKPVGASMSMVCTGKKQCTRKKQGGGKKQCTRKKQVGGNLLPIFLVNIIDMVTYGIGGFYQSLIGVSGGVSVLPYLGHF